MRGWLYTTLIAWVGTYNCINTCCHSNANWHDNWPASWDRNRPLVNVSHLGTLIRLHVTSRLCPVLKPRVDSVRLEQREPVRVAAPTVRYCYHSLSFCNCTSKALAATVVVASCFQLALYIVGDRRVRVPQGSSGERCLQGFGLNNILSVGHVDLSKQITSAPAPIFEKIAFKQVLFLPWPKPAYHAR